MFYLFKKNRAYLTATFFMIFYAIVFLLAVIMILDPMEKEFAFDKLTHFSIFSLMSYFIYFVFAYQDKIWFFKKHRTALTILLALAVGTSIEIVQLYMPTRTSSIYDVMADLSGTLFTILVIKYSPQRVKKLKRYGV
ncbi:MAG TPA: VanZ family protein [Ignavibacteriaceae bacterium]